MTMRSLVIVGALLAALGVGFVAAGRFIDDFGLSLAAQGAWFCVVAGAGLLAVRRDPALRIPVVGTLASCAAVGAFAFYWTTIRDDTVSESVATGVKASEVRTTPATPDAPASSPEPKVNVARASGPFRSPAHTTTGTAAIVDLADGGRRLTLTDLETDNGPDLFVYLVPGSSNPDVGIDGGVNLGRLKGNIGTQQYDVPADADIAGGASVVIWCRAFTVAFGAAQLQRS
jgi:hypothetical protein